MLRDTSSTGDHVHSVSAAVVYGHRGQGLVTIPSTGDHVHSLSVAVVTVVKDCTGDHVHSLSVAVVTVVKDW